MLRFEARAAQVTGMIRELPVLRGDAMRGRLRVAADGEDVVIDLPRGEVIRQGDIFGPSDKGVYYQAHIEPEQVLRIDLQGNEKTIGNALRLGYSLGSHHLEVLIENEEVFVPLTISHEKIEHILKQNGLRLNLKSQTKTISIDSDGYFAGEEHGH